MKSSRLRSAIKAMLPNALCRALGIKNLGLSRPRWGNMRRLSPFSRLFGLDRGGKPIDRVYIEGFLQRNEGEIQGEVLEIGAPTYTQMFGGEDVSTVDVLHATPGNPRSTIVGDLTTGEGIPISKYDCMILTQTFLCIFDVRNAIRNSWKALKPGGVLLATVPGVSQISRYDMDRWGDYWRFTDLSARRLFEDVFGEGNVDIATHGNILVACAFLHGLATHELRRDELDHVDPDYQVLITVKAVKNVPMMPPPSQVGNRA